MCNLSQGIKEDGIAIGRAEGEMVTETRIIINMYKKGFTAEQIAAATDKDIEDVKVLIGKKYV